jgi:hypothetical protein
MNLVQEYINSLKSAWWALGLPVFKASSPSLRWSPTTMNTVNQAAFQFAYGTPSSEGYSSSQLSSRHYAGVNPREILNTMSLPALRIHKGTPKMPAKGRKAHRNHLQSYYDPARALQSVLRLKQTLLHLNIIECKVSFAQYTY